MYAYMHYITYIWSRHQVITSFELQLGGVNTWYIDSFLLVTSSFL